MKNKSSLFDPLTIGQMTIPNRFVRSATGENRGKDGRVTDSLVDVYRELAKGEIGLIVTGVLYPKKSGRIFQNMIGADADDAVPGLSRIADVVHENGGKIAAQIGHGGGHCIPEWTGFPAEGPSSMVNPHSGLEVRELSADEIRELIDLFVKAARRTVEAGFDAVQIHAAHSHLISQFLSPVTNRRDDEWGGSAQKRSRFLMEIYRGIRKNAGLSFPILVKLGLQDTHPEGKTLAEGIATARTLAAEGIDALEVSEGYEEEPGHHIRAD
ncbi:MAG: NADH:flavin oxidoreductase, partial [Proteobacteria bacterium]|nr:NADH:flavin oxidoreductase [Pseudomonadota bacterium]